MRNKYGAKKVEYAGYSFSSGLERSLFEWLKLREANGEIKDIKCQESVYMTNARILYKPDFSYVDVVTNEKIFAESKGFETDVWRIKRRLWAFYGEGKLEVYKGKSGNFYLHETIEVKGS